LLLRLIRRREYTPMAFKRIKNLPVFAGQNAPANG